MGGQQPQGGQLQQGQESKKLCANPREDVNPLPAVRAHSLLKEIGNQRSFFLFVELELSLGIELLAKNLSSSA